MLHSTYIYICLTASIFDSFFKICSWYNELVNCFNCMHGVDLQFGEIRTLAIQTSENSLCAISSHVYTNTWRNAPVYTCNEIFQIFQTPYTVSSARSIGSV